MIYKDWGGAEFKDVLGSVDYLKESGYEFLAVNDRFGLQSSGDTATDIFNSVGTTE